eukprot:TRINITY_DN8544_c1_g1_i4.p1 TRINITY_DN8544_c1_g1~~TRINITY_DN8544_c1_g1_i4.p1  ORF type:complete len:846 (+),score=212.31 TRINITY_DN8544_c1_g1_i4:195-2732(+)
MRPIIVLLLLLGISASVQGVTYYFAQNGLDSNACNTTDAPCQTIDRLGAVVSSKPLKGGDSVLFRRGDAFRGQMKSLNWVQGAQGQPITFAAYGNASQPQPIISGTTLVSGWSKTGNGLWSAKISNFADVENLFVDGVKMGWGRTPDVTNPPETRYLNITASNSNMLQTDQIKDPSGTWNGAIVRVRIYLWSVTTRVVQSHTFDGTTATFTLTQGFESGYQPAPGWKFFLENKLAALTQPGEWAFDAPSSSLTLYPLSSAWDPIQHTIEAAVYQLAFDFVISDYITFSDLHFRGQIEAAVKWDGSGATSHDIQFLGCTFTDQEQSGIEMGSSSNIVIANCSFTGMQNTAINIQANSVSVVGNSFTSIGMVQGHQNKGGGVAVGLTGDNNVICYNQVTNISYNGIVFTNSHSAQVYNNFVSGCTLTMSDGGGIYTYGSDSIGSNVQNNIVANIRSLPWDGFTRGDAPISNGIYIDNYCSGITISGNTVVDVDGANFFANSGNHKWTNNLLVGGGAEGEIGVEEMPGNSVVGNVYSNNIVYIRSELDVGAIKETSDVHKNTTQMASYSNNIYCNPYGSLFFTWNNGGYASGLGWQSWQAANRDSGSSVCKVQQQGMHFYSAGNISSVVSVMNKNPSFTNDTSNWSCDKCTATWVATSPLGNKGAAKITVASSTGVQFQQGGLTCKQGTYYRITFTATASEETVFWTGLMMDHGPWMNPAGNNLVFVIPANQTRTFDQVFQSTISSTCMINLSGTMAASTTVFVTNMFVEEVTVQPQVWDFVAMNPTSETAKVPIPPSVTFSDLNMQGTYTCYITLQPWTSQLLVYNGPNDPSKCSAAAGQHRISINE